MSRHKPASAKQLAANRANAARSSGPKTPEGKARSSQNAVKHGFTGSTFAVVRLEDLDEVANLKSDLVAVYRPVNAQELGAIEHIALAQHSMIRAYRLESGLFTTCLNETLDTRDNPMILLNTNLTAGDIEIARAQNRNYLLAEGFHQIVRRSNSWTVFLRYQAQAERLYRRALEDFDRLKALRSELPNEPDLVLQPPPESTTYPPSRTNPNLPETAPPQPPQEPAAAAEKQLSSKPQSAAVPAAAQPPSTHPPRTAARAAAASVPPSSPAAPPPHAVAPAAPNH